MTVVCCCSKSVFVSAVVRLAVMAAVVVLATAANFVDESM